MQKLATCVEVVKTANAWSSMSNSGGADRSTEQLRQLVGNKLLAATQDEKLIEQVRDAELSTAPAQVSDVSEQMRETVQSALVDASMDGRLLSALAASEDEAKDEVLR